MPAASGLTGSRTRCTCPAPPDMSLEQTSPHLRSTRSRRPRPPSRKCTSLAARRRIQRRARHRSQRRTTPCSPRLRKPGTSHLSWSKARPRPPQAHRAGPRSRQLRRLDRIRLGGCRLCLNCQLPHSRPLQRRHYQLPPSLLFPYLLNRRRQYRPWSPKCPLFADHLPRHRTLGRGAEQGGQLDRSCLSWHPDSFTRVPVQGTVTVTARITVTEPKVDVLRFAAAEGERYPARTGSGPSDDVAFTHTSITRPGD
jgi:hypothetical protein